MRNVLIVCFLALISITGCVSTELERPNVPIWVGVRVDATLDSTAIFAELDSLKAMGIAGVLYEAVIYCNPTDDTVRIDTATAHAINTRLRLTRRKDLNTAVSLVAAQTDSIFRRPLAEVDTLAFLAGLQEAWRHILLPPTARRVGLSGLQYRIMGVNAPQLHRLIVTQEFAGVAMALPPDSLQDFQWTPITAVVADSPPDGNAKAYAQAWHPKAVAAYRASKKPIVVVQANILGANRLEQLKNHLRFWPEDVEVFGVVLNSIYPTPSVLDSTTHYGLANDAELMAWLKAYTTAPRADKGKQ